MHPSVPDECKPILLSGTQRIPFPSPIEEDQDAQEVERERCPSRPEVDAERRPDNGKMFLGNVGSHRNW